MGRKPCGTKGHSGHEDRGEVFPRHHQHLSVSSLTVGTMLYAVLIFVAAAYPFVLPYVYILFFVVAMPMRLYDFLVKQPENCMFLLDFCYWVNAMCFVFLMLPESWQDGNIESTLYALADGPVSFALLAWQNAWVMSSQEHTISVLIHLLPGLAMFAHRHMPRLSHWGQLEDCAPLLQHSKTALEFPACVSMQARLMPQHVHAVAGNWVSMTCIWLIGMPLLFYSIWQCVYWILVQVVLRRYIQRNHLDTSFKCLARRERRKQSIWSRMIFAGSTRDQIVKFGVFQMLFTLVTLLLFIPTYFSWHVAFLYQTAKFMIPTYFGARHMCTRLIDTAVREGVRARLALSFFSFSGSVEKDTSSYDTTEVCQPEAVTRRKQE